MSFKSAVISKYNSFRQKSLLVSETGMFFPGNCRVLFQLLQPDCCSRRLHITASSHFTSSVSFPCASPSLSLSLWLHSFFFSHSLTLTITLLSLPFNFSVFHFTISLLKHFPRSTLCLYTLELGLVVVEDIAWYLFWTLD